MHCAREVDFLYVTAVGVEGVEAVGNSGDGIGSAVMHDGVGDDDARGFEDFTQSEGTVGRYGVAGIGYGDGVADGGADDDGGDEGDGDGQECAFHKGKYKIKTMSIGYDILNVRRWLRCTLSGISTADSRDVVLVQQPTQ